MQLKNAESFVSTDSDSELRDRRIRKAKLTAAVALAARGISVTVGLISVPLLLNYFDEERYGLWLIIGSIVAYLNTTDLGFGLGLQNRVAEARGSGKPESIGALLSTAMSTMLVVGTFVSVLGILFVWLAPVPNWFQISSAHVGLELRWTLTIIVLTFAYLLPARMIVNTQRGFQEGYMEGFWGIGSSIANLFVVMIVVFFRRDLVMLALLSFSAARLIDGWNFWYFFKRHPTIRVSRHRIDFRFLPSLFSISWQFFVVQVSRLLIEQTDNLIIAIKIGVISVVPFGVAYKLISVSLILIDAVPWAFWPAFTEAKTRQDWSWIRTNFKRNSILTVMAAAFIAANLLVWGQEFILFWAGPDAAGSTLMMAGLCLFLISGTWVRAHISMVNALGRPIEQVLSGTAEAVLHFSLALLLINQWGLTGIAWSTILASLLVSSWFLPWRVSRIADKKVMSPWAEVLTITVPSLSAGCLAGWGLGYALPEAWPLLLRIAFQAVTTSVVFVIAAYFLSPEVIRVWLIQRSSSVLLTVRSKALSTLRI